MERLLEILEEIQPDIDYATCTDLVDGHLLDSLSIIALVAELEDAFDITIPAVEITPQLQLRGADLGYDPPPGRGGIMSGHLLLLLPWRTFWYCCPFPWGSMASSPKGRRIALLGLITPFSGPSAEN